MTNIDIIDARNTWIKNTGANSADPNKALQSLGSKA